MTAKLVGSVVISHHMEAWMNKKITTAVRNKTDRRILYYSEVRARCKEDDPTLTSSYRNVAIPFWAILLNCFEEKHEGKTMIRVLPTAKQLFNFTKVIYFSETTSEQNGLWKDGQAILWDPCAKAGKTRVTNNKFIKVSQSVSQSVSKSSQVKSQVSKSTNKWMKK